MTTDEGGGGATNPATDGGVGEFQSTLAERDIAEELAADQRQISIAEFFERNKHMLGFDSGARALVTAVKEAVDNALDAAEEAGYLPDIYVEIRETGDYYTVIVEDNGPGITKEQIPNIFGKLLYGSRFHKREQSLTPDQRLLVRRDGAIEFIPIGELCDAYLHGDGEGTAPVTDDVAVPSFNRKTHEMSWEPVTHAIRHETDERTYEITTEKGRSVEVTGNHSVFTVNRHGETQEVKAGELEPGDVLLTPRRLPSTDEYVECVNLLDFIQPEQVGDKRLYVYGFDRETLAEFRNGETVRKRPSEDSERERYYYRYEGVDILRDSLEQNYLDKGYLPIQTVLELGWEEKAADCEIRTYQVGGAVSNVPVSIPIDEPFVEMLAHYLSEGHAGPRQVGFTFGSHEAELIKATERAVAGITGSTTTVQRERNSTRVKAFGSPFAMFLKSACGGAAADKRIPGFVFDIDPELQHRFIAALYQGDGSDAHPGNELSHTTVSQTLARQLSVLWNMQGVLASTEVAEGGSGYAPEPHKQYRTKVYGEDVNLSTVFESSTPTGEQGYKRIPTALLDDVRVAPVKQTTVPDTIPGLLMGAGVGSSLEYAEAYRSPIEDALDGERIEAPRFVFNLKEKGLLDDEHRPTARLRALWGAVHDLHGLTDTDMCFLPVKDVRETEPPEHVYDISVPGATGYDENFVVVNEGALSVKNSRGQQGIGISAAVLYSQLTSGTPAKVTSRTPSATEAQYFELIIDTESNEPEIQAESTTTWERPRGTRIELRMEANMRARSQLHDYVRHTAVVNPHGRIELVEPDAHFKFERATDERPAETESIRPHPHGVELGTVIKMLQATDSYSLSGFLQEEFTRVGAKTAGEILDGFRDRHFGREMAWRPPRSHDEADLAAAVTEAIANKSAEATDAVASRVADRADAAAPVAHHELVAIVHEVADDVEAEFGETFGATVRENAVEAGWAALTADRVTELYELVAEATSDRKDDEVVRALAERIAAKFDGRDRATHAEVTEYVRRSADATVERDDATIGETARNNVTEAIWDAMRPVPDELPKVAAVATDRDAAADLLEAMRATEVMAPPTNCLAPIRADLIEEGLKKEVEADFYTAVTRSAEVHGGDPFVVEAGIAYGGELEDGKVELMRFANRVPLVYQQGACAITDVVRGIDWRNYGLEQPGGSGIPAGPAVILVHLASTNVPFTSESKDAVANIPAIEKEVELAVRDAARDLKSHLNKRRSLEKRRKKQAVIFDILPKMAAKVAAVTGRPEPDVSTSLARIMNNVLVTRAVEDGTVELTVANNTDAGAQLEITEIVSGEPSNVSAGTVVDMDDEWFVRWEPTVPAGEEATLTYALADGEDADFDVHVEGIEEEKLTIDQ